VQDENNGAQEMDSITLMCIFVRVVITDVMVVPCAMQIYNALRFHQLAALPSSYLHPPL
jgi:hypothetical protein